MMVTFNLKSSPCRSILSSNVYMTPFCSTYDVDLFYGGFISVLVLLLFDCFCSAGDFNYALVALDLPDLFYLY